MRQVLIITALALSVASTGAAAGPGNGCPPGLAKKSPACVPPGLAKKQYNGDRYHDPDHRYRRGDRIGAEYIIIREPDRYGLDRGDTYARIGNYVYRIDRDTREILDLIGAVSAILN